MKSTVIKMLIFIICMIGVIVLFTFADDLLPSDVAEYSFNQESEYKDAFTFEPEELSYDGTGDLDLLKGVMLDGYSAQELESMVFTRIYKGDSLSEKTVEYTAETDDEKYRSTRPIKLYNYKGPKIHIPDDVPEITRKGVGHFGDFLMMKAGYAIDDGFGKDVREHANIEYKEDTRESALVHYTISFDNMFGDSDVAKVDVTLSGVPAYLALTESEVTLKVGDVFDPTVYIARAELADGSEARAEVHYGGDVNTAKKGTYEATYDLEGETLVQIVNII